MYEMRRDVWQWLLDAGTVTPSRAAEGSGDKIRVDQYTADHMESGVAMARALEAMDERHIKQLVRIKTKGGDPNALKAANWKILCKVLFKYSIKLTDGVLNLILDGDFELVLDIYYDLFARVSKRGTLKMGPTSIEFSGRAPVSRRDADADALTDDELLNIPIGEVEIPTSLLQRMQKLDDANDAWLAKGKDGNCNKLMQINLGKLRTCEDLFVISMMQFLDLRGSQVAGMCMLGPAHVRFERIIVSGVGGAAHHEGKEESFAAAGRWIGALHNAIDTLTATLVRGLRERNRDASLAWGARVLGTLQPGLISHNLDVAALTCDLMKKLGSALLLSGYGDVGYRWLILEGGITRGGLPYMVACAHQHAELRTEIGIALDLLSRGRMLRLFTHHLPQIIPNKSAYLAFAQDLVAALSQFTPSRDATIKSGLIEYLMGQGLSACHQGNGVDLRQTAVMMLTELWCMFPRVVMGGREGQANQIVESLKKGARDPSLVLQIACIANLFHLLEATVNDANDPRNPHAPRVYKTLIFLFIENHSNEHVREFIVVNLANALEPYQDPGDRREQPSNKMLHIPVGVLVTPTVKQCAVHGYNNHDFDLFVVISRHARLTCDQCMPLADLLGKVSLNDPLFGRSAAAPLEILMRRFGDIPRMHDFVERFVKVALSSFMHVETRHGATMRSLRDKALQKMEAATRTGVAEPAKAAVPDTEEEGAQFDLLVVRHALIVHMLELIVQLENRVYETR